LTTPQTALAPVEFCSVHNWSFCLSREHVTERKSHRRLLISWISFEKLWLRSGLNRRSGGQEFFFENGGS
jgi:hypothetical protein